MSDPTTYRKAVPAMVEPYNHSDTSLIQQLVDRGSLVPDHRLQAIADAPRCEHGKIDRHICYVLDNDGEATYHPNGHVVTAWCVGAPELRALIGALVEGDSHGR